MALGTMEDEVKYVRTQEEVTEALKLAKIEDSELKNVSQVILSAVKDDDKTYRLLELDDHLSETLNEGNCLSFKGTNNSFAVLCSNTHTYEIKQAETSNLLLLIPELKFSKDIGGPCADPKDRTIEGTHIVGEFHTYYELIECKPKLDELIHLLEPSSFKGMEYEKDLDPDTLYDWEKLLCNIQASEEELREAVRTGLIVNMNGKYRRVAFEFEARSLTLMLDLLDENSWELDEVDKEIMSESLKELIPHTIFDYIFNKFTEPSEKKAANGEPLYRFLEEKTCRVLAQILLAASPVTAYKSFMEAWRVGGPDKLKPQEKYLSGLALIKWNNRTMMKEVISYPESNLPDNIMMRLNELFKVREKWTVDDISPYISRCATRTADVNALLTKYARPTMVNGVKHYCSKHGK